jgi:3-hydroxyphenylacetate 6-hydroxylase
MLALNWGDRVCSTHDSLFKEIIQCEETISRFRSATGTLQDFIPILRFLPFNTISSKAIEMRSRRDAYLRHLNSELLNKISSGVDMSCIQAHILGDADLDLKEEDLLSLSLTMLSSGFALSTTIIWAVKLLSVRADIQEKAWSEIHRVYGNAFPGNTFSKPGSSRQMLRLMAAYLISWPSHAKFFDISRLSD